MAFAEWTLDGELRQTTFLGWRDDKDPSEVVLETQPWITARMLFPEIGPENLAFRTLPEREFDAL